MATQKKEVVLQPLLLNIPEVAESLRLSRAKVYRLIYYEGLPVVHFGRSVRVSVIALKGWLEQVCKLTMRPNTYKQYYSTVHHHLIPAFGHIKLQRLTTEQVQAFYAQ